MGNSGTSELEPVSGRRACGAVAYPVDAAASNLCHCYRHRHRPVCRRPHGALFAARNITRAAPAGIP